MEITLNLLKSKKFNKHYNFCIGSGHAPLALRKDYVEQLKFIHDTLNIKYVRFHDIFSESLSVYRKLSDIFPVPGAERFVDIDFSSVGEIYDNVLSCSMKPFVELSFMPKHLAKNLNQRVLFYYGGYSSMPRDDAEYQDFIKQFVLFLIDRYGKEEVESWPFEVWNEPDLIVFFGSSQEDYFHLYEITVRAIKEIDENIKVGGPSTSGSKWIKEFLTFINKNNVPCDFLTTHQYAGDPIGNIDGNNLEAKEESHSSPFSNPNILKDVENASVLEGLRHIFIDKSETQDIPNDSMIKNCEQIVHIKGNLPLYYTEWNENATFSSYTNDTRKVAAYIIRTALKMEGMVNGTSLWCFSDIFEEMHMFNEEFHGGFGILTKHGIKKPSYYAMSFLNELSEERYIIDDTYEDITLAAFKKENETILLLTRQYMKNLPLPKEDIVIHVNKSDIKKVLVKAIDENSGNPLKEYESLNKTKYLKKEEIELIKQKSDVKEVEISFKQNEDGISFKLSLGVNDCYLVKLQK